MHIKCEVVSVPAMKRVKNYSISCSFVKPYSVSISFRSISIFKRVPSSALFSYNFFVIESFTIALNNDIYEFTSRSSSKTPYFRILCPNMKARRVRSWVPTFPTSFYKKTESYRSWRVSSNLRPKKDFTTVRPAIFELNSIEFIVKGEVLLGLVAMS